jgi:hypothetical protein
MRVDTEDKLLSIAEFDFGFNSLQEIFDKNFNI